MTRLSAVTGLATLVLALACRLVGATPILFNFNSLQDCASDHSVQSYMRSLLPGGTVRVTGAMAESDYNADGHVVGPVQGSGHQGGHVSKGKGHGDERRSDEHRSDAHGSDHHGSGDHGSDDHGKSDDHGSDDHGRPEYGHEHNDKLTVQSVTLGTSDGGVTHTGDTDTFLVNASDASRITMRFSFPIYSVSFDYEIFPDGTCATGHCSSSSWPDFTFVADGVTQFHTLAIVPGASGTYSHSPFRGPGSLELAPQFLGQSGEWLFPEGVARLDFVDWPRTIGIDNLRIDISQPVPPPPIDTPEPSSLLLFAACLAGIAGSTPALRRWSTAAPILGRGRPASRG